MFESCILHKKLCSIVECCIIAHYVRCICRELYAIHKTMSSEYVFTQKHMFNSMFAHTTMFGVEVESCILHMKLCSVFKSRAVFCTLDYVRCISRELYFAHENYARCISRGLYFAH